MEGLSRIVERVSESSLNYFNPPAIQSLGKEVSRLEQISADEINPVELRNLQRNAKVLNNRYLRSAAYGLGLVGLGALSFWLTMMGQEEMKQFSEYIVRDDLRKIINTLVSMMIPIGFIHFVTRMNLGYRVQKNYVDSINRILAKLSYQP